MLLLCAVTCAAFFCRKDTVLGIPLPSIPVMFGFLLVLSHYGQYSDRGNIAFFFDPIYITYRGNGFLLLFVIYALFSRQTKLFIVAAATATLVFASSYIHKNVEMFRNEDIIEVQEYLFGLVCLFYSLELLLAQRVQERLAAILRAPFASLKLPGGRGNNS